MSGQSSDGALVGLIAIAATVFLVIAAALTYGCDTRDTAASRPMIQETR